VGKYPYKNKYKINNISYANRIKTIRHQKIHSQLKVSPKRWIVERTFAWLENFRRLSQDFEYLLESSQAMLYWASIKLILQ
jgi:putative transposase